MTMILSESESGREASNVAIHPGHAAYVKYADQVAEGLGELVAATDRVWEAYEDGDYSAAVRSVVRAQQFAKSLDIDLQSLLTASLRPLVAKRESAHKHREIM